VYADNRGDHILIWARGTVDLLTVRLLDDALHEALRENHASVLLDLAETTYLACCAVRPLAKARRTLEATGRRLVLTGAEGPVLRLLLHSELHDVLTDHEMPATAVANAPRPAAGQAVDPPGPTARCSVVVSALLEDSMS